MSEQFTTADTTRREILKKAVFVAPVILTLPAVPSFASAGSGGTEGEGERDGGGLNPDLRPKFGI